MFPISPAIASLSKLIGLITIVTSSLDASAFVTRSVAAFASASHRCCASSSAVVFVLKSCSTTNDVPSVAVAAAPAVVIAAATILPNAALIDAWINLTVLVAILCARTFGVPRLMSKSASAS